jgi:hypothetical protein
MMRSNGRKKRQPRSADELLSGAFKVCVYAGTDPVTKRPNA